MTEPIIFITTMNIHAGKLEQFKEATQRSIAFNEKNGPQLLAGVYIDEENMLAQGLQVHRDSQSILSAWQMAEPYIKEVMQYITTTRVDIYGQPNEAVMAGMQKMAGESVIVSVKPRLAGFQRLSQ